MTGQQRKRGKSARTPRSGPRIELEQHPAARLLEQDHALDLFERVAGALREAETAADDGSLDGRWRAERYASLHDELVAYCESGFLRFSPRLNPHPQPR